MSSILSVGLLIILALAMFGLGLTLAVADFTRVAAAPRAVVVTLVCQTVVLPAVCFGLVVGLGLAPAIALGMMLLAASPGGPMSSVFSHLAGGDVALNVTLTGLNAVLSLVTMPLITWFALAWFRPGATAIAVAPEKLVQVFTVVLIPVMIGMVVRARAPDTARRMQRPVFAVAIAAVVLAIGLSVGQHLGFFLLGLAEIGVAVVAFCVLSFGLGYLVPRVCRIGHRQAVAAGLEIGIHNEVVALTVAVSVLGIREAAFAPALYGAVKFVLALAYVWLVRRRRVAGSDGRELERHGPATA